MSTPLSLLAVTETTATPLSFEPVLLALLTLAVLYALFAIASLRREVVRLTTAGTTKPVVPTVRAAPTETPSDDLPPELIAVIAAAVHVTLGSVRHRIVAMTPAEPTSAWSVEGRREVFLSHRVR